MKVFDELEGEHGRYHLQDEVGAGGMGQVFLAVDGAGAPVAVKTAKGEDDPVTVRRFQREVALLKSVQHPHVLRYRDAGLSGGQPFVVTDFVQGVPLSTAIAERGPEELAAVAPRWARELAAALAAVHAVGIVHRDLKPANVIVRDDGGLVLIDFGLAKSDDVARLTASNEVLGTLEYLAPDVYCGAPATPATDVYGWGLLVHEMLTRRRPFSDLPPAAALEKRCEHAPDAPAAGPLGRLAAECLQPLPRNRPAQGRTLVERLEREAIAPPPAPLVDPPSDAAATQRLAGDALPIKQVGGWNIVRQIARGGNSTVYEALRGAVRAAVKVAGPGDLRDEADRQRFAREARVLAAIESPRVVRVLDSGVDGTLHYLALELLEGETLAARLSRGPLTPDEARALLVPIAEGVAALHAAGIVHRDLKPGNVVLAPDGPRLVDFGLARRTDDAPLSGPNDARGTRGYVAPEVVAGKTAGPAADVFALGVMTCELFTRTRDPRNANAFVADLVQRATAADPAARIPHGAAFLRALLAVPIGPSRLVAVVSIAVSVAMILIAWLVLRQRP